MLLPHSRIRKFSTGLPSLFSMIFSCVWFLGFQGKIYFWCGERGGWFQYCDHFFVFRSIGELKGKFRRYMPA
jgi:hypothetical protein